MAEITKPPVKTGSPVGSKLLGQNYTTPDLVAKVTGKARYAEDFRAEGMLFCKLLLSPMPHARVVNIDASAALVMPGVKAILTADDLPGAQAGATLGENVVSTAQGERPLTMEPVYEGEPILAVAAVDELTAAEAIEKIIIEFEPLPFNVDVVNSMRRAARTPACRAIPGCGRRHRRLAHLDARALRPLLPLAPPRCGRRGSGCRCGTCRGCGRCCCSGRRTSR
jgi:hypothetical protein